KLHPPLPDEVARRCRFIVEEDQRVSELAEALGSGQREDIRRLCAGSYDGAMKLYEIGTPAMETMMGAMLAAPGVIGARQAGAGFGGCMVALVEQPAAEAFAQSVRQAYYQATGVQPEIYPVRAAAGAGLLEA
ncbi:MAG: galactokinase, partial [Candidatus Omnitrophica bacterium]|nr:galactokinase [Candidatus Omnitrophota bacterium]